MCEKHNNIHKTVQNTFQHETVDLKTPLQDLQLKFFYPYNVEKMRLISIKLLFLNLKKKKSPELS
jgi:hypothetical protein